MENDNVNHQSTKSNSIYYFGIAITIISAIIFGGFSKILTHKNDEWFFINYMLFAALVLVSLISGAITFFGFTKSYKNNLAFPIMVCGTISCFSVNNDINIFYTSCNWLMILLIIVSITVLAIPFITKLSQSLQKIAYFILGLGCMLYLYFSIVLIPIYPMGAIGIIFLGLGIHAFVPIMSFIALTTYLYKAYSNNKSTVKYSMYSVLISLFIIISFAVRWHVRTNYINNKKLEMTLNAPSDLPDWVTLAQRIPADNLSKKILMSNVMYTGADLFFERGWNIGMNGMNAESERVHDPLITIATLFSDKIHLDDDDIIKVMEASYDIRHLTESRLWTGKDLKTTSVSSNVRIYPNERLAYTEKIITIVNNNEYTWNGRTQEAIYTFYLPEGSTISSLSLWIDGKEEKGYLTTKGKAQKAYTQIVGVENRDPSVVHWQEGNRVSVRVFPCTVDEPRQFKIGITSPLTTKGDRLSYENIYFKGPDASDAREIIQVNYTEDVKGLDQPASLRKVKNGNTFRTSHDYRYKPNWKIQFKKPSLKQNQFIVYDKQYSIEDYTASLEKHVHENIYLDINKSWNKDEWEKLHSIFKTKNVFVFTDKMTKVNQQNSDEIFEELQEKAFTLFPFYKIDSSKNSLVITKSSTLSPNLNDLKTSDFYKNLIGKISTDRNIDVINIGEQSSPYLKTLSEFRAIDLRICSIDELYTMIKDNIYFKDIEDEHTVFIPATNIVIKETSAIPGVAKNASDQAYRLYAYNTVLKQLNMDYYAADSIPDNTIELAAKANVVTPLSSLVVLEKQEDYERFDIKKNKDSIGNASMHSDGSVPEPHEWALIFALGLFIVYALKNKRNAITVN